VPRIANGVIASGWPELAVLLGPVVTCTATLVGCRTAVTAAHCVCDASGTGAPCEGGAVLDPTEMVVLAPHAGLLRIGSIEVAPGYSFGVGGDVALLSFDYPLRGVPPRAINELARPGFATAATILGFGRTTEASDDAGVLRSGAVVTASCGNGVPNATHVCWNHIPPFGAPGTESNTCSGDSGGPLFADVGAGPTLVGVHSGGFGSCEVSGGSFDTDVFVHSAFLRDHAGVDLDQTRCGDGAQIGETGALAQSLTGIVATQASRTFSVAAGTKLLRVALAGELRGDVDLFVRAGAAASPTVFDCASAFAGPFEYCEIEDPSPGLWYALVVLAAGTSAQYQLTTTRLPETPAPPPLAIGDVLVSNFASFETLQLALASGDRATHSSSLRGSGAQLTNVEGIALDRDDTLLAANPIARNLLRIHPATGDRTIVSGCVDSACASSVGAGAPLLAPRFVAIDHDETLLVADRGEPGVWALVRVDPVTGDRTIVSGCTSAACSATVGAGPPIGRLFGLAIEADRQVVLADAQAVYRIDPASGARSILSGCPDAGCAVPVGSGPVFGEPIDVAIGGGALFVTYRREGSAFGALRRIDAVTGARTLVSGCEDLACATQRGAGPAFADLFGIAFDRDGTILVTDSVHDSVLRVDPASGDRTLVAGCADAACSTSVGAGPEFAEPLDIAVVPEPGAAAGALAVLTALALSRRAARRVAPTTRRARPPSASRA
jgi:hypothetical protein